MVDACTAAGILPFYGPYGDIKDVLGCETQFRAAFLLGCVGAWSLHPVQIDIAKKVFSPDPDEVAFAKKVIEAIPDGAGVHMIDGKMQDDATWKQCHVMVDLAEMLAAKDPELAEAYGMSAGSARMRFFEYEAREIVKRAGIPVTDYGFATTPQEAREIAVRIGEPVVIKSQVLTGGRMKAGGVQFADTPDEAAEKAEHVLALEINGHMPRGVLVDPKAQRRAGVLRRRRVGRHPQAAGDALQRHGRHRHRGGRREPPRPRRARALLEHPAAERLPGQGGHRLGRGHRARSSTGSCRSSPRLARLFVERDMTLAEINPLGELEDGSFVALDAHMDMENEARPRQTALLDELGVGDEETRQAREATAFELAGEAVDAMDHRGVAGNVTEFDGDLGLVIGAGGGSLTLFDAVRAHGGRPANYCEIGGNPCVRKACGLAKLVLAEARRRQDRGDDVDRLQHARRHRRPRRHQGVPGARLRPGREDRDLPHPGRLGGGGLQDPRALRRALRRPLDLAARGGAARGRKGVPA